MSRDCRSRIASEKQSTPNSFQRPSLPSEPKTPSQNPTPVANRPEKKQVTCFTCHQKGHKSPQCPQKIAQVRKVQIPYNQIVPLKENELFGLVGGHCMPITCDSGADITVVPEERVRPDQFTGGSCEVNSFNKVKVTGKRCSGVLL